MNNFSSLSGHNFHSLIDWFVLSGVSYEVAERTAYETSEALKAEKRAGQPEAEATPAPQKSKAAAAPSLVLPKFQSLEELNTYYKELKELGLCRTASSCVIGQGNLTPQILVITDTPEDQEDRSGIAFSSLSNQMIQKALGYAGFAKDDLYFTYLSKWRPPGKRALTPQETEVCTNLLKQEIALLRPKAILTLGESTLRALWPDSLTNGQKIPFTKINENQLLDYEMPFIASQKSEFLVKNGLMKKSFWFSLLEFAATIRT